MQTDYERYRKMSSLAQIGWWEADITAGYYLCSDYLCDLLGLEGDTISSLDFLNLIREDYREQIAQEFWANSSIHKDFYEQTFPVITPGYGEVWLHTRLAFREKGTGNDGGDKSFGIIQRVEAPKDVEQRNALIRVNNLLRRQNYISQSLLRFLRDEEVESCITEILKDILTCMPTVDAFIFLSTMKLVLIIVVPMRLLPKEYRKRKRVCSIFPLPSQGGGAGRYYPASLSSWIH